MLNERLKLKLVMMAQIPTFTSPCTMPNGLQWFEDELYVLDQYSDNLFVLDQSGVLKREIATTIENGSGITIGGGYIWVASNGRTRHRHYRSTDSHLGYVYKLNLKTGRLVDRFRTPDGGGIHGIEWDDGLIWVTAFDPKALMLCDPMDRFNVVKKIELQRERAHGLARVGSGIWCAHTDDNVVVKYDMESGIEMDVITIPDVSAELHGLSMYNGTLWFCDALFLDPDGSAKHGFPGIGMLKIDER